MSEPETIQRALASVIRDPAIRERVAADPEGTLTELGLDASARASTLRCGVDRLLAYHEMVHSRLFRTIKSFMGSAGYWLGDARVHADVRVWVRERGPKTGIFREVPAEFVAWARPRWADDPTVPDWVGALAEHEVGTRTIRNDPGSVGAPTGNKIELEQPVVCNQTARVLRYAWPLHRVPAQPAAEFEPAAEPVALVGYRGTDDRVRYLRCEPRDAALLERLLAGETLRAALFGACEDVGQTLDDEILGQTALTLADWMDRHILHGSE